jgi:alanyl-tRNA synthetase
VAPAIEEVSGVPFLGRVIEDLDPKELRGLLDAERQQHGSGVFAIVATRDGRASIAVSVSPDLASANSAVDLVRAGVAALGGQGGGGRPDMAQGGGPDASKAADAISAVKAAIRAAVPA